MMRILQKKHWKRQENDNLQKTVEEIAAFVLSYNG